MHRKHCRSLLGRPGFENQQWMREIGIETCCCKRDVMKIISSSLGAGEIISVSCCWYLWCLVTSCSGQNSFKEIEALHE